MTDQVNFWIAPRQVQNEIQRSGEFELHDRHTVNKRSEPCEALHDVSDVATLPRRSNLQHFEVVRGGEHKRGAPAHCGGATRI
jgi:hypothetical protein